VNEKEMDMAKLTMDVPKPDPIGTARRRIEQAVGVLPRELPDVRGQGHDCESDKLTRAIIERAAVLEATAK
jgi:hypothetical protein